MITLPVALLTTEDHLKYYARILFFLSCISLALVILATLLHTDQNDNEVETCIKNIYELTPTTMQNEAIIKYIPALI